MDRIVLVSMRLLSELLCAAETAIGRGFLSEFKSCIGNVVRKHHEILTGFDFKWLELNAYILLSNLSKVEPEKRREKCVAALFDLLHAAFSCSERLGVGFEYLDKPALIYNVNHSLFEQYELARGIIHEKLVWFKKEKTKGAGNGRRVRISLRCGDRLESTRIPEQILKGVIESRKLSAKSLPLTFIRNFLNEPIGAGPLRKEVSGARRVAILLENDFHSHLVSVLELVLKELKKVSIPKIDIVLASGLNKQKLSKNLKETLSNIAPDNYSIVLHDAFDEDSLTEVGRTLSGARLKINTRVAEADYRIAIGSIRPHPYSGFTGGYQAILPGVAGAEAIVCNQVRGILLSSRIGSTADNPLFRDIQSAASLCGIDFLLNTVENKDGKAVNFVAGDPEEAYAKGVEISQKLFRTEVDARAEVVVLAPGTPYDQDLYTSLQSLGTTRQLLKPNGLTVLMVNPNHEDIFTLKKIVKLEYDDFPYLIDKDPKVLLIKNIMEVEGRNLIIAFGKAVRNIRLPIINVDTLGEAIDQAMRIINPSSILVVREAWNVIPEFKNGEPPLSADF